MRNATTFRPLIAMPIAALVALSTTTRARGQGGETSAIVLELPASARAMALGGAGVALDGDAAVFYNPAQLASVSRAGAGLSVQRYILSSTLGAVSAGARFGPGTIALGAQILQYASEPEIVPDEAFGGERGRPTGNMVDAGDLAVTVGYAIERGRVRVGGAAKVVRQRIVDEAGTAGAADLGVAVRVWREAMLGVAVQNIGTALEIGTMSADLPRLIRVGGALPLTLTERLSMLATADLIAARDGDVRSGGGGELHWQATPGLAIVGRAGGATMEDDADGSPFSAGAAVIGRNLALDYAFRSFDAVGGGTHRIGVRWWR
jgi:hypothetical protein